METLEYALLIVEQSKENINRIHNIAIKIMLEDDNYQVVSQVSSMDNIALALTSFDGKKDTQDKEERKDQSAYMALNKYLIEPLTDWEIYQC